MIEACTYLRSARRRRTIPEDAPCPPQTASPCVARGLSHRWPCLPSKRRRAVEQLVAAVECFIGAEVERPSESS